jgi:hypothetical protein
MTALTAQSMPTQTRIGALDAAYTLHTAQLVVAGKNEK